MIVQAEPYNVLPRRVCVAKIEQTVRKRGFGGVTGDINRHQGL